MRSSGPRPPVRPRPDPSSAVQVAVVAVGGVAGAGARYGVGSLLPHGTAQWPWSTLLVNVTGCLLIGVLMVVVTELVEAHPLVRPLLGVGVLGGYTTFSTYAADALSLVRAGRPALAACYLAGTPVLAVLAAAAGAGLARASARALARRPGDRTPPGRPA